MKTLNGYEIVGTKVREDINGLQEEGLALKSEIPIKVSQLENDSKFITREEVLNMDLSEYTTENELNAKNLVTQNYVENAIVKAELAGGNT